MTLLTFLKLYTEKKNIILLSHNNLEHIRDDVIENYNLLKNKLIFTNQQKLFELLNSNFSTLNSYFDKEIIKSSIDNFNAKVNVKSEKKIYHLSKCIEQIQKNI